MNIRIIALLLLTLFLLGCISKTEDNLSMKNPAAANTTINSKANAETISIEEILQMPPNFKPSYEIAREKDASYGTVERKMISILLPDKLRKEEVENNFKQAILESYKKERPDAITIWGYKKGDDVNGTFTVGDAVFSPNGKWEDAQSSTSLNNYKAVIRVKDSYLNAPKILAVGTNVLIASISSDSVKISNSPGEWGAANIIGRIPNGTKGTITDTKVYPGVGDYPPDVLYKVKVNGQTLEGWLFESSVKQENKK